jgi:hypothetical protein
MDINANDKELYVVLLTTPPQLIEMNPFQVLSTLKDTQVYEDREEAVEAIKEIYPEWDEGELEIDEWDYYTEEDI